MVAKYNKNENSNHSSLFLVILLSVLLLAVVGFLVGSNIKISKKRADLTARYESLKEEFQSLQEAKKQLQAQISQSGESDYLEKEARERFNLQKPGEEVVVILPLEEKEQLEEGKRKWLAPLENFLRKIF